MYILNKLHPVHHIYAPAPQADALPLALPIPITGPDLTFLFFDPCLREKFFPRPGYKPGTLALHDGALTLALPIPITGPDWNFSVL